MPVARCSQPPKAAPPRRVMHRLQVNSRSTRADAFSTPDPTSVHFAPFCPVRTSIYEYVLVFCLALPASSSICRLQAEPKQGTRRVNYQGTNSFISPPRLILSIRHGTRAYTFTHVYDPCQGTGHKANLPARSTDSTVIKYRSIMASASYRPSSASGYLRGEAHAAGARAVLAGPRF